MSTDPNRLERRGAQRFEVHQPLAIRFEDRTVPGFIQDLSGRGIFFYAESPLPEGAVVELTFTMPSEITLAESMPVRCRGKILRTSATHAGQRNGIAAQLSSYQYLPTSERVGQVVRASAASAAGTNTGTLSR